MKRRFLVMAAALMLLLTSCKENQQLKEMHSEADLSGLKVGMMTGTAHDLRLSKRTDITTMKFNLTADALMALSQGKVDVFVEDESSLSSEEMRRLGLRVAFYGDEAIPCGFPMRKNEPGLRDSLSYFIDSLIATGEMKEIWDRWLLCDNYSEAKIPDLGPVPTGKPLRVAPCIELPPMDYHAGDDWRGLEPELLLRFGRYAGRPVVFEFYPLVSAITALQTGKIDIFTGGIFITEERQKTMDFSSSYGSIRSAYYVKDENAQASASFFTKMKEMVYNNLIVENRWTYITDGLWETVKISVLAILLGSLVGAGICWMRMSRRKWLAKTAAAYIDIMRGIPMLVFLMIMFYVILVPTGMGGTAVAVISFALNFAAYVSEMFRTAINAVSKGQSEAGLALGLTKWQTFRHIVAPQAIRNVMPVYKGEAISLLKTTSIVGYIAIQDLTRASDIIRSRTFDAFFPLLIVTILYFILAWLLGKALDLIVKNENKK